MNLLIQKSIHILLLSFGLLSIGCFKTSDPTGSSGSNWLKCNKVQDCDSDKAVTCDSDGYCLDREGERIAAELVDDDKEPDAGDDALDSEIPNVAQCAWGVSDILAAGSVMVPDRVYCGEYGSGSIDRTPGLDCFFEAIDAGTAAQITIDNDMEGGSPTTYVGTADGEHYAVLMENGYFGDAWREAKLERCGELMRFELSSMSGMEDIACRLNEELYQCTELLSIPRAYQVQEVPTNGEETTTLHLYLSNQSADNPIAQFSVFIQEVEIVRGEFGYEGPMGPAHNWSGFDIEVPVGRLSLRAKSYYAGKEFEEEIEVPEERWAVLDYQYSHDGTGEDFSGEENFTINVYDEPVVFR